MYKNLAVVLFTMAVSACSMPGDTSIAEREVPRFHAALNAGQFSHLYDNGADELKKAATKNDFVKLLGAVNKKLGNVRGTEKQSWRINYHTSGTFAQLVYKTSYANGEATEQFVYRIKNDKAILVGYQINSNALITN